MSVLQRTPLLTLTPYATFLGSETGHFRTPPPLPRRNKTARYISYRYFPFVLILHIQKQQPLLSSNSGAFSLSLRRPEVISPSLLRGIHSYPMRQSCRPILPGRIAATRAQPHLRLVINQQWCAQPSFLLWITIKTQRTTVCWDRIIFLFSMSGTPLWMFKLATVPSLCCITHKITHHCQNYIILKCHISPFLWSLQQISIVI